jgi:predicted RNA-binding Zn-ribbon protein involved in translation (DUF1610 family)
MASCAICGKSTEGKLCASCGEMLGLVEGPPARQELPCARCGHGELVRALVRELTIHPGSESNIPMVAPLAVSYAPRLNTALFGGKVKGALGPDEQKPFGILELYVCTRCGFSEWYARDPASIPIGPQYGTEKLVVK